MAQNKPQTSSETSGTDVHPRCPHCDRLMYVVKRSQHPGAGAGYELQTFACLCGESFERRIDKAGHSQ